MFENFIAQGLSPEEALEQTQAVLYSKEWSVSLLSRQLKLDQDYVEQYYDKCIWQFRHNLNNAIRSKDEITN